MLLAGIRKKERRKKGKKEVLNENSRKAPDGIPKIGGRGKGTSRKAMAFLK